MIYCHFSFHQILIADVMAGGSFDYFVINCGKKKNQKKKTRGVSTYKYIFSDFGQMKFSFLNQVIRVILV